MAPGGRTGDRLARTEVWEVTDCTGMSARIQIDGGSVDDRLYLLRRIEDAAGINLELPGCRVRYLGVEQ